MTNFIEKTKEYYSKWLGKDDILNERNSHKVLFIYSDERNKIQRGYSKAFDLYVFYRGNQVIVSYGDKAKEKIDLLRDEIFDNISITRLKTIIEKIFLASADHSLKYYLSKISQKSTKSKLLRIQQYPIYKDFFQAVNPKCKEANWLHEYYTEMTNKKVCFGFMIDEKLICCSDAPTMPYLENEVQEIGINTLNEYANSGYATDVCISAIRGIIKNDQCPQWSTTVTNIASQKLAKKIGFEKLADVITISL